MKKNIVYTILFVFGTSFGFTSCGVKSEAAEQTEKPAEVQVEKRVKQLLSQMTLEEKVGQMMQVTLDVVSVGDNPYSSKVPHELNLDKLREGIVKYHLGSILNTAGNRALSREHWHEVIGQVQEIATKETRLGIPVLYGVDAIHGVTYTEGAALFPQQIGQAATWNRELVKSGAEITAYETRASGIPWNFSPVLGLGRDPRWPRQWETFGEDVFLSSELGKEMITGMEGNDLSDPYHLAACAKHFLGYSSTLSGKDRTPAWIPERQLREYFVPAFAKAFDAGVHTVMINSGEINGVPVHASRELLTGLMKEELGFKGFAVTDWQDIMYLHDRHRIASSYKDAVKIAVNAGVDMSMVPYDFDFAKHLVELVNEGEVPMSRIDDAVGRILRVKIKLGLFEKPLADFDAYADFGSEKHHQAAYQTALESITLLKNEQGILPLSKNSKVLVTGPNANTMRSLNGGWSYSWQGELTEEFTQEKNTILEAVQNEIGKERVTFVEGVRYKEKGAYHEDEAVSISKAVRAARNVDYILLCLGENSYTEKPGDLEDLYLSENQTKLAQELAKTGKPVILVLTEGRPRVINKFEDQMQGVVMAYLPGNEGGNALADILFGDENPSGKLPYTYPRYPNSLVTYDHKYTEELANDNSLYKSHFAPQYEFGYGLSYTTFEYGNLKLDKQKLTASDELTVSVEVTNSGQRAGKEVVQLYVSDLYASITPSVKRLRGFDKISLKAGETKTVSFTLPAKALAFIGKENKAILEAGEFEVNIGGIKQKFELTESQVFAATAALPL